MDNSPDTAAASKAEAADQSFLTSDTEKSDRPLPSFPTLLAHMGGEPGKRDSARGLLSLVQREGLASTEPARRQAQLLHHAALLLEQRHGDEAGALQLLQQAKRLLPHELALERSLRRILWQRQSWARVVASLDTELSHLGPGDSGRRAWLLLQKGQVLELGLDQQQRAHDALLEAADAAGDEELDVQLLFKLRRSLLARGRHSELADLCRRGALAVKDRWLGALLWRLRGLSAELRLDKQEEAREAYAAAVALEPGKMLHVEALARTLHRLERWEELVQLLLDQAEAMSEAPFKRDLLLRAARVNAHCLGRLGAGRGLASMALAGQPGHLLALLGLGQPPPAGEDLDELLDELEAHLAGAGDSSGRAALHLTIGRLCSETAALQPRAARHLLSAIFLEPDLEEAHLLLLELRLEGRSWEVAARTCRELMDRSKSPRARVRLLRLEGELQALALGDLPRAAEAMGAVLAIDPNALFALDALSWLTSPVEAPQDAEQSLEKLVRQLTDPIAAAALLCEAGDTEEITGDPGDGLNHHRRACQLDPTRRPALEAMERGAYHKGDGEGAAEAWQGQLALEEDHATMVTFLLRLAAHRERMGDLDQAAELLTQAAELDWTWILEHEQARVAVLSGRWIDASAHLLRMAGSSADPDVEEACHLAAAQLLADQEDILEPGDLGPRLEAQLTALDLADGEASPARRTALLLLLPCLARIRRIEQRPDQEEELVRRALELDPHHLPSLDALIQLLAAQGRWQDAVAAGEQMLEGCGERSVLLQTNRAVAAIYDEELQEPDKALAAYQNLSFLAPEALEPLEHLHRLNLARRDWHAAAATLEQLAERSGDAKETAQYRRQLARLHEVNFGEPRLAVAQLQQALAIHPTDEDALEDLTRLMSSLGDWTALCDAIRTFLASLPPHRQGEGLRQRMNLGRLLTHRLGLPSEALEQFSAVVEIDPTLPEARLASAILLEDSGREEEALGEHRELLEMDPLNLESLHRTAAICARRGAGGRAGAALGLLVALNEATAAEAEQQEPLCAPGRGGVAEIGTMEAVLAHPAEHGAAMRVLDVLGPTGNQLPPPFRPQPFSGSATPLTASGGHPVQEAVSAICRLLGVPRLSRILLAGSVLGGAGFYASNQLGLVVDRRLAASAGPAQLRSVLAGVLSYHRSFGGAGGLWLAHGQIPSRLEMLISAAYLVARADDSAASHPSRDLLALAGALDKAMPSNQREQLQDRCAALRSAGKLDYEKWAGALEQTALRCSLWIAGDLPTVLDGLRAHQRRRSGQDDGASPMEWLRRDDPAKELVKFWLSEEHLSHRS